MEQKLRKPKPIFKQGAISAESIGVSIANHQTKTEIGAHNIFMGQVRADEIEGKKVVAIEYTANEELANEAVFAIREKAFEKYELTCMHIYHSLGEVRAGEICLFIFVSSPRRNAANEACRYILEAIKKDAPIFGKEIFEDSTHQWKVNN
ncbi:MAG: molybdopterin synthase catalytic subunit [Salibacteraceae bacterium]|jgi:molybdopterin synthase catalytic subunit|tara:strand:- start:260 stop:709 length:450 start_codon:yes stop_codon:yes gene_type:complete